MKMKKLRTGSTLVLLLTATAALAQEKPAATPRSMVLESNPMLIDRLYPSMTGPEDRISVDWSDLDWITAVRTEVIDEQSGKPMGEEFFCHSQLQLMKGPRFMVMATGAAEVRLPPGYGVPLHQLFERIPEDRRSLDFFGMVLNNCRARAPSRGRSSCCTHAR